MLYRLTGMQSKTKLIAASLVAVGVLFIGVGWVNRSTASVANDPTLEASFDITDTLLEANNTFSPTDLPTPISMVIVYISGAVQAPDVYELPSVARLKDVVVAAGGLLPDADADHINLAERLTDGEHIHIPRIGESSIANDINVSDDASGDNVQASTKLVNINTASADELDSLPGIGQAFAERIIEYRTTNGPFKTIEELRNVKGIGAAVYDSLAALITVDP